MKLARSFLATNLFFSLVLVSFLSLITVQNISAQDSKVALQRGYRTGYSDGYMSGYRDVIGNATKSFARHPEYEKADRAFNQDYGRLEDYRDGYQQGFEIGYNAGFDKSSFDAALPANLAKRGVVVPNKTAEVPKQIEKPTVQAPVIEPVAENTNDVTYEPQVAEDTVDDEDVAVENTTDETVSANNTLPANKVSNRTGSQPVLNEKIKYQPNASIGEDIIVIPTDTELIIELIDEISTERARVGDVFKARVISPNEISGAIIEGRITKIQEPGRLKRRSELLLSFDRIILTENRWSNFNAIVVEVLPVKGDNVRRVDVEGTVEGNRRYKSDAVKIGASTGTGMVVGGLIGGPAGVAVGAGVGAAFGVGAVVIEKGKHIELKPNQQLRIRTNYETQIR
jgi:hypothetical protein